MFHFITLILTVIIKFSLQLFWYRFFSTIELQKYGFCFNCPFNDVFTHNFKIRHNKLLLFKAICWIYWLWFERVYRLSKLKFFMHTQPQNNSKNLNTILWCQKTFLNSDFTKFRSTNEGKHSYWGKFDTYAFLFDKVKNIKMCSYVSHISSCNLHVISL